MALLTALGGLLGGLSNTSSARTGTNANTYSTSGTASGGSSPTFNPLQTGMQGTLSTALTNEIQNGPNLTPAMTSGTNAINQTYQGIGDRLNESLASRGFGNSGASGSAALETNLNRAGAVGNLQSQLQTAGLGIQQQALGQALGFGFAAPGSTYSSTTSGTGTSNGSYTLPGSAAAGALSGGMTSLLAQLNAAAASGGL